MKKIWKNIFSLSQFQKNYIFSKKCFGLNILSKNLCIFLTERHVLVGKTSNFCKFLKKNGDLGCSFHKTSRKISKRKIAQKNGIRSFKRVLATLIFILIFVLIFWPYNVIWIKIAKSFLEKPNIYQNNADNVVQEIHTCQRRDTLRGAKFKTRKKAAQKSFFKGHFYKSEVI